MSELPDGANFFSSLETSLSRKQIAALFERQGWDVSKAGWEEYEVQSNFAELIIEAEKPVLIHGPVADVLENGPKIVDILSHQEINLVKHQH